MRAVAGTGPGPLAGVDWPAVGLACVEAAVKIAIVLLVARVAIVLATRLIDRLVTRPARGRSILGHRRADTLAGVIKSVIRYVVGFVAAVISLALVGVDTSSLLLGAGVAGLAVGFGAQNLVRDVLSGFFILYEDQYGVGDYVTLGEVQGIVEEIGLRTTQVRGFGGELHVIPNGSVTRVANFSRGPLRILFEVCIPHPADVSRAMAAAQEGLDRWAAGSKVLVEGPKVLGVSRIDPIGAHLLVWARAKSLEHWAAERHLKLAVKEALDGAGISISLARCPEYLRGVRSEPADDGSSPARG